MKQLHCALLLVAFAGLAGPAFAAAPKPDPTLTALWSSAPLSLSEDELRKAGLADATQDVPLEYLVNRVEITYDAEGSSKTTRHLVMRYRTREAVEMLGTFDVPYAPWFENRPNVLGRVVPARGAGVDIDPRTIAESAAKNPELIVSDRKNLVVPLPHLSVGATVELVIEQSDHKSPYGAAVRNGYLGREPTTRATIVQIAAPAGLTPKLKALETEAKIVEKKDKGLAIIRAEMIGASSRFGGAKAHGVMWSVGTGGGAGGWEALAKRYGETLAPVLSPPSGSPPVTGTRMEKIAQVIERVAKDLRYTGLHLGDAAIVPFAPKDTLQRGYGDCKDLASLVVRALLDSGVEARVALLRAGDALAIDPELPGLDLFDHAIVYVPAAGSEPALWLDGTAPEFGVGPVPSGDLERLALVIDPGSKSLTATPKKDDPAQTDTYHLEIEYRPEPIGPGRATLSYAFTGAERHSARRLYAGQDPDALEDIQRVAAQNYEAQLVKTEVGADDALKPVTIRFELADVRSLDSDGRKLELTLGMATVIDRLDAWLEHADRRMTFELPRRLDYGITYRVIPPQGYRIKDLPKDVDVAFGLVHWKVSFTEKDGVVIAHGRYDIPQLDYSAKEIAEVIDQADERGEHTRFEIELVPEQGKLSPLERAAWFRKELERRPKDVELRARWALELDKWGVGDEARKEVDIAAKDAAGTQSARFVLTARARLWERDTFGRVYQKGWNRKRAAEAWRAVLALDPKSIWARHELADILIRDDEGQPKRKRDKEGDEGRAMLEATAKEGSETGVTRILEAWDHVGAWKEIVRFAESWKGARIDGIDQKWAKAVALTEGPAAVATLIESWAEPRRIQTGLSSVTSSYMMARRFADASAVFDSLSELLGGAANPLAEWTDKVKKLAPMEDFSTPDKAFQSFYSLLAASPDDLGDKMEKLFGRDFPEDEAEAMKKLLRPGTLAAMFGNSKDAGWAIYDLIFGLSTMKTEGDEKIGWETTLQMTQLGRASGEPRELGKAYFAPNGKNVRLVGFAGSYGIAAEAFARLEKNDVEGARKWLVWAWKGARYTPKTLTEPEATTPVEALWRTAFLLAATSSRPRVDTLAHALEVGGQHLVGDERGVVVEALVRRAHEPEDRALLLGLIDKLFAARPPSLAERAVHARLLAFVGKKDEALQLAGERLLTDPTDAELILEMASVESLVGELDKARDRLIALRDIGRLEDEGHNELAWLDLCVGKVDDKSLESAKRAAKKGSLAAVHTRAMIEIERGLLDEGAESARRLAGDDDEVDASVWLVTGRMAEALGLKDLAGRYYKKVSGEDEPDGPTSSKGLAQARAAKLGIR